MFKKISFTLLVSFFSIFCLLKDNLIISNSLANEPYPFGNDQLRLQESNLNSKFSFDENKYFSDYIKYTKDIIKKARIDQKAVDFNHIVEVNSPFLLEPASSCTDKKMKGALMVHGLGNSSSVMIDMAKKLQESCLKVFSITLPGHGTRPGDLLSVTYQDWLKAVQYGVKELSKDVDELYLVGYSIGGALSLLYANEYSNEKDNLKGLILYAPAIEIDIPWYFPFHELINKLKKWPFKYTDDDFNSYHTHAINAQIQVVLLIKALNKSLQEHKDILKNKKIFAAFTYEDTTILSLDSLRTLFQSVDEKNSSIVLYHQKEASLPNDILEKSNLMSLTSTNMEKKILGISHLGIIVSPKNPFYGETNGYRACYMYEKTSMELFKKCKNDKDIYSGEITKENLNNHLLTRLQYNPLFEETFNALTDFFNF